MANQQAPRDSNQVPTMLGVDDVTGETRPVAVDSDGNLLVVVAGGTSGTVTDVSVVTANGLAGSVANSTTTPAITLSTTVTGILSGNGTAISAASTTGSGNVVLATSPTLTTPVLGAATATSITASGNLYSQTALVVEETGAGTDTITIQAPSSIAASYTLTLPTTDGDPDQVLTTDGSGVLSWTSNGPGTVTSVSVVTANGVSGSVATATTTPAITLTLGDITPSKVNGLTISSTTGTLTITNGKTFSVAKTLTLDGTDGTTMTFPTTSATIARTDAANAFTGASTASAWVLTAPTITTSIVPTSNDGAPLGDTTHQFSDLFLAEGGVINWDNGDATLTQVGDVVTLAGADLKVTTPGTASTSVATIDGSQTLTNKTITSPVMSGTWTASGTVTLPAITAGGSITLAENSTVALDPAGSADGKFTGITVTATAGYTQAFGDLVYLDPTDSRWEACDANSAAGADGDSRGLIGMVVVAGTDGNPCTILLNGIIRADAKFPTFTVNNPIYVSETAAAVTQTQPTTTDVVIRIVGAALTADEMYFNPDNSWITHT